MRSGQEFSELAALCFRFKIERMYIPDVVELVRVRGESDLFLVVRMDHEQR